MDIFVREVRNMGVWDAFLDGTLLVRAAPAPVLEAARRLLAMGYGPSEPLRMWHLGASFASLTTTIGAAARHRIATSHDGKPEFRKYTPDEPRGMREAAE
jgi:hypothetical protein